MTGRAEDIGNFSSLLEIIGDSCPLVDAILLRTTWRIYKMLGLSNLSIELNSIGARRSSKYEKILKNIIGIIQSLYVRSVFVG
jgi:histidyl-tRNA synthetase